MDSRYEDYEKLKSLLTDLTELVTNLRIIQTQDSLQRIAVLPEEERNRLIDDKITAIKEQENTRKEQERREQAERNFIAVTICLAGEMLFRRVTAEGIGIFIIP